MLLKQFTNFSSCFGLFAIVFSLAVIVCCSDPSSTECPPWSFYNTTANHCQCYHNQQLDRDIHCTETSINIGLGNCMTYEINVGTFFAKCFYFQLPHGSVLTSGYLPLPWNVSELNDFMCGLMHRKGRVCSECINGFGPSMTSFGYKCTKCSGSWKSLIVYALVEFGPTTIFYFLVLTLRISMTSSPMNCFIFYSQLMVYSIFKDPVVLNKIIIQSQSEAVKYMVVVAGSFYGVWNLDILKYIIPPLCISPKLSIIHIEFLSVLSALYSLLLIILTWICVELHGRNYRLLVIIWKPFHQCFVQIRNRYDTKKDIIDVFATFLLLTYSKLIYQSVQILSSQYIMKNGISYTKVNLYDPTVAYMSVQHLPYVVVSLAIIVVLVFPPPLILLFYTTRVYVPGFGRIRVALHTFVEKFYGCYRDQLDGGRDMRYFSVLYFFMRPMVVVIYIIRAFRYSNHMWCFAIVLFGGVAMLIAFVKPYKKTYMNLADTLLLSLVAVLCLLMATPFEDVFLHALSLLVLYLVPMIVFLFIMIMRLICKVKGFHTCKRWQLCMTEVGTNEPQGNTEAAQEAQCLLPPSVITATKLSSYDSI